MWPPAALNNLRNTQIEALFQQLHFLQTFWKNLKEIKINFINPKGNQSAKKLTVKKDDKDNSKIKLKKNTVKMILKNNKPKRNWIKRQRVDSTRHFIQKA